MLTVGTKEWLDNGEIAGLMREVDWAQTPLGPPENWPQGLQAALGICLDHLRPRLRETAGEADDVSERKQARVVMERHRLLSEKARDILWMSRPDGQIVEVNEAAVAAYGYSREEFLRLNIRDLREASTLPLFAGHLQQALAGGIQFETIHIRKDGNRFPVEVSATSTEVFGERLVMSVVRDITARKQAEAALRANHDTFRHLVENSPFGIYVVDADFRLTQVSVGAQRVFENVRPLIGRDFAEVLRVVWAEPFASEAIALFRHTLATGEPYHSPSTVEQRGDSGAVESYDWKIERITLPDGRFGVVCHFYDLSERQRYEAELRASEGRFRLASDAAAAMVYDADLTGARGVIIHGLERVTGHSSDASELSGDWWHSMIHPDDLPAHLEGMARHREAGGNYKAVYRVRRKDGAWIWIEDTARIVKDEMGAATQLVGAIVDITERKRLEAEREQLLKQEQRAREAAEQATRAKDEFLAVVSHELRSPLNAILGYARITRLSSHDAEMVERNCEIIERSARVQQQLIEDLLDTARIISGKLKLDAELTDLRLVLEEALSVIRPAAEAKQIDLAARLGDLPVQIIGDAVRLRQIVWNLLQNAIKFTPSGGRVELQMEQSAQHARLVVRDTGRGIEPEFLPAVFDRFSQQDAARTRRHGGLGLGLALVKQLVEMHGGTIEAASAGAGAGATFTVSLPLFLSQAALQLPPASTIAHPTDLENDSPIALPRLDGLRVLLVDDQEEARMLVSATLSSWGAAVKAASSGAEARALMAQEAFDVLVCDIAMPDEDGYEVLARIRALERERGVPLSQRLPAIALTALARPEDRLQALYAGFQMHIAKPVEPVELGVMISSLIRNPPNTQ